MQKQILICVMLLSGALNIKAQDIQSDKQEIVDKQDTYAANANKYIAQYKGLAISEQKRSGIPAAVILGQGILETEAGCSDLCTKANNHFGIKCKREWQGETFLHTDDAPDECFRKYKCVEDSYKDHSDYLKGSPRYAALFHLSPTDYAAWAFGLKRCGYATNPRYSQQLIKVIEDFHLQEYTYAALNDNLNYTDNNDTRLAKADPVNADAPLTPNDAYKADTPARTITTSIVQKSQPDASEAHIANNNIVTVNGLRAIYASKGEMLLKYAVKYNIRYEHLLEINDLPDAPLEANMVIYLERKNAKGAHDTYTVKDGETLRQISQLEGMQLKKLMSYNHINAGEEPVPGTLLQLRDYATGKPQTVAAVTKTPATRRRAPIQVSYSTDAVATTPQATNTALPTANPQTESEISPTPNIAPEVQKAPEAADVYTASATNNAPVEKTSEINNTPTQPAESIAAYQPAAKAVDTIPAQAAETKPIENAATDVAASKAVNEISAQPIAEPKPVEKAANSEKATDVAENKLEASKPNTPPADTVNSALATNPPASDDPLAKLKAQLDKVVYADDNKKAESPKTAESPKADISIPPPVVIKAKDEPEFYVVKKGDTAFSIAKRNNITIHQLMDWNNLDFDAIKTGQKLRIK